MTTQPTKPDKPSEPAVKIDYSELNKWIKEKQGLDSSKYTKDTWDLVEEAYNKALNLRNSKKQDAVDAGAKALKEAIEGLKEMDYTLLEEAIAGTVIQRMAAMEGLAGDDTRMLEAIAGIVEGRAAA